MSDSSRDEADEIGVLGFLGSGAITRAIVTGLCTGPEPAPPILLSPRNARVAEGLATRFPDVTVGDDNQAVIDGSDTLVLAVRPQGRQAVLDELRLSRPRLVVSLLAGVAADELRRWTGDVPVVRAIPLPAVANRTGITATLPPHPVTTDLFGRLGGALPVTEVEEFDALSAVTATLAAHLEQLATIATWLQRSGFDRREAGRYVASLFAGLAPVLRDPGVDLVSAARDHATPGGLNEQFARDVRSGGMEGVVVDALDRILERVERTSGVAATPTR